MIRVVLVWLFVVFLYVTALAYAATTLGAERQHGSVLEESRGGTTEPATAKPTQERHMNKKQLIALVHAMVLSVQATANADAEDGEPPLTEDEARVLLGTRLKRKARGLVADVIGCEASEVVWTEPPAKPKKSKEEATEGTPETAAS
jgi:hypothetical protein